MSHYETAAKDKVPLGQKAAYGTGTMVLNLLPASLAIFSFFLITGVGFDPVLAGLLSGLPRLFDAITDPIMGFITDNTNSRWGRRRPYIVVGAILSGVFFALMWHTTRRLLTAWWILSGRRPVANRLMPCSFLRR